MIRLTIPSIDEKDLQAVREVVKSGFMVGGLRLAAFEQEIANLVGTRYAVAVTSGTASLHLALLALNVGPGDIVLTSAYSFIASANVIELCGARPVFVDVCSDTFNIDPDKLEKKLEELIGRPDTARKVKAILPIHNFGQLAEMPLILKLAKTHGVPVIEDAACALGAKLLDRQAGNWGTLGCFSFHPRKVITTGEGGMITSNDKELVHRLRILRNHGENPDAKEPDFIIPGFNYRMTEFQAALGYSQLAKLDRILAARRKLALRYDSLLAGMVQTPRVGKGSEPTFQSYVVLLPEKIAAMRGALIERLKDKGVEATIGTYHVPMATYYRSRYGYRRGDFPATDEVSERALTIPLYEGLSEKDQNRVAQQLRESIDSFR